MTDSSTNDGEEPTSPSKISEQETSPFLKLAGLWEGIMTDEEVDEFIRHIYEEREKDKGRPPPTFD